VHRNYSIFIFICNYSYKLHVVCASMLITRVHVCCSITAVLIFSLRPHSTSKRRRFVAVLLLSHLRTYVECTLKKLLVRQTFPKTNCSKEYILKHDTVYSDRLLTDVSQKSFTSLNSRYGEQVTLNQNTRPYVSYSEKF